jgi:hypothetical protein
MPYGKKWSALMIPPFHPGDKTTDEQWSGIFGGIAPQKSEEKVESACKTTHCPKFKDEKCVFAESFGTERCLDVRNSAQNFSTCFKLK